METATNLIDLIKPTINTYVWMAVTFIVTLLFKDILTTLFYGLLFYLDKSFNEGDKVIVDGQKATIIKIGLRKTVFLIEETKTWRYVVNDKVRYLKLEKRIDDD